MFDKVQIKLFSIDKTYWNLIKNTYKMGWFGSGSLRPRSMFMS